MTGDLIRLFLFGAVSGGCSVFLFFLRRVQSGAYPSRIPGIPESARRARAKKKRGKILAFFLDFLLAFLAGTYLVLYDATVLGGRGRLFHLFVFFCGLYFVRFLFLSLLFRPTERVFRFAFDLIGVSVFWLFFPIRKCFSFVFANVLGAYLILKRKNDKIRRKTKAKREFERLLIETETAFLPSAVIEAIASRRN